MAQGSVARLGYEIDSSGAVKAAGDLDRMHTAAAKAERGAKATTATAVKFSGAMKSSASQTANLGAQLNDIGVMLAAGQNPLQLAVQQGTQINQVFAQMGGGKAALRGLAAGFMSMVNPMSLATLGIIAGGSALVQWGVAAFGAAGDAGDLEAQLDSLATILGEVDELTDVLEMSVSELSDEYGTASVRVRNFAVAQAELTQAQSMGRLAEQFSIVRGELDKYAVTIDEVTGPAAMAAFERQRNALSYIARDFKVTSDQAGVLFKSLSDLGNAGTFEEQQVALQVVLDDLQAMDIPLKNIPTDLQIAIDEMITLGRNTDATTAAMERLASAARFAPGLNPTMDIVGMLPTDRQLRGSRSRGGGGGRTDPFEGDLERLRESLRTEQEVVNEWYLEQQVLLNDQRSMEILGIEGHNEAKLRLEEEYQERLAGIRSGYDGNALDQTETFLGDMASALQGGNDKMIAAAQAFASVEALINAYRAYNQVIADPSLPWFAKIPAAVGVLSAGLKTVQSIKSLGSSSGSAGSASSAGVTATSTAAPAPQRQDAVIQLEGALADVLAPLMDSIVSELQSQSEDGVNIVGVTAR